MGTDGARLSGCYICRTHPTVLLPRILPLRLLFGCNVTTSLQGQAQFTHINPYCIKVPSGCAVRTQVRSATYDFRLYIGTHLHLQPLVARHRLLAGHVPRRRLRVRLASLLHLQGERAWEPLAPIRNWLGIQSYKPSPRSSISFPGSSWRRSPHHAAGVLEDVCMAKTPGAEGITQLAQCPPEPRNLSSPARRGCSRRCWAPCWAARRCS